MCPPSHASRSVGPPRQKSRPPRVGVFSIAIDSSFYFAIWHLHEPHCSNRSTRTQNTSFVSERENKPPRAGAAAFSRGGPTETAGREGGRMQNSLHTSTRSDLDRRSRRGALAYLTASLETLQYFQLPLGACTLKRSRCSTGCRCVRWSERAPRRKRHCLLATSRSRDTPCDGSIRQAPRCLSMG